MIVQFSTEREKFIATMTDFVGIPASANSVAESLGDVRWEEEPGVLADLLLDSSELRTHRSLVIELAAEDYQLLRSQGAPSDVMEYCKRFSTFDSALYASICRRIEVEKFLDDHPSLRSQFEDTDWPIIGERISDYHVIEELGRGALARVYLCSQSTLGSRQVVVKVSLRGMHEGSTLGKLQHPHIMDVHSIDVRNRDGLTYLCTPFLGRSTLSDLLNTEYSDGIPQTADAIVRAANIWQLDSDRVGRGPQSRFCWQKRSFVAGTLHLAVTMAEALAHAHASGVIHGDLKPSNILLTPTGDAVLLDFNLARDNTLALDVRGGTLPYMAPEEASLLLTEIGPGAMVCDERSDIFSFGVLIYELLSGRLPYEICSDSPDPARQLIEQQRNGARPLNNVNPQVGRSLAAIIHRCLAFEPHARYASMNDLRAALAKELSPVQSSSRWARRHKRALVVLVAALGIFSACIAFSLSTRPPYYERQYEQGLSHFADGQLDQALNCLVRSVSARPDFIDAQFARARVNLQLGNIDAAIEEFGDLAQKHGHASSMAGVGYCFNLRKPHALAVPWYKNALAAGYETAAVHNNLAISYELENSRNTSYGRLQLTEHHLEKAFLLDPASPVIRMNLARLAVLKSSITPEVSTVAGIQHLESVLASGMENSEVYAVWVQLYAPLAENDKSIADEVISQLINACKRNVGIRIDAIESNPHLRVFRNHPQFADLEKASERQTDQHLTVGIPRFTDPFE